MQKTKHDPHQRHAYAPHRLLFKLIFTKNCQFYSTHVRHQHHTSMTEREFFSPRGLKIFHKYTKTNTIRENSSACIVGRGGRGISLMSPDKENSVENPREITGKIRGIRQKFKERASSGGSFRNPCICHRKRECHYREEEPPGTSGISIRGGGGPQ